LPGSEEKGFYMDRETIVREIKRIAREIGSDTVSKSEFKSKSGISEYQIYKHFDSWNEAVEAAGLTPTDVSRIDDAELFREMKEIFVKFGGVCTRMKFDKLSKYSVSVYKKHFGKWNDILLAFGAWLKETGEDFPFSDQLPDAANLRKAEESIPTEKRKVKPASWDPLGTITYGPFLNFRGLQHAPVNEQGVVFLFGMVCFELGFVVEAVRTSYPDCEAKRRVNRRRNEWERVRIEFEYCSSDFQNHGHDPNGCDVIVCWQHDWTECPLEVIELKTAIQSLSE
jgi:hypothetical protein